MTASVDAKAFRDALGAYATGVTIVTTRSPEGIDVGVTANSFNSVSLEPPLVLWSLSRTSSSFEVFERSDYFVAHVLASDQEGLSNTFAKRGVDKFASLRFERGQGGAPLLEGCAARFQCRVAYRYEGGDHIILVGEVLSFDREGRKPLAYLGGKYAYTINKPQLPAALTDLESNIDRNWLNYLVRRASHQIEVRLRSAYAEHGLDMVDSFVLHVLLARDGQPMAALDALLNLPHVSVNQQVATRMHALGLLQPTDFANRLAPLKLTEKGRNKALELLGAEGLLEQHIGKGLDHSEMLVLKDLLWRVINNTNNGLPAAFAQVLGELKAP